MGLDHQGRCRSGGSVTCGILRAPKDLFDAQIGSVRCLLRRVDGRFEMDPWGFDPEVHSVLMSLGRARWDLEVAGLGHVPESGPVLLVVQRRLGLSEQGVVSLALASIGRRVRRVGIPGPEFLEAPLRLTGSVMADPAEVRGLLRDGHVVSVPMSRSFCGDTPGSLDPLVLQPAVDMGVPVLPVAVHGLEWGRKWQVIVDAAVTAPSEDGRLGAIEMAGRARDAVAAIVASGGN